MAFLDDRDGVQREFFRLVNSDANDTYLTEHDSGTLEGVLLAISHGYEDAQLYLIDCGMGDYWLTDAALTVSGSDPNRTASVPSDFLRLYGTEKESALRKTNGTRWGTLIPAQKRWEMRGNYYYFKGGDLYFTRGASIPSDVRLDYIKRVAELTAGSTALDFPEQDQPLIAAFAAVYGMEQAWLPGGQEMEYKLMRNLETKKQLAWRRARQSRQPKMATPTQMIGDHWF